MTTGLIHLVMLVSTLGAADAGSVVSALQESKAASGDVERVLESKKTSEVETKDPLSPHDQKETQGHHSIFDDADDASKNQHSELDGSASRGSMLRLWLGGLLLVGSAGTIYWLKGKARPGSKQLLNVVETVSIGPKRSLIVVEYANQKLLLGSTEGGIGLLHSTGSLGEAITDSVPEKTFEQELLATQEEDIGREIAKTINMQEERRRDSWFKKKPASVKTIKESVEEQDLRRKLRGAVERRA